MRKESLEVIRYYKLSKFNYKLERIMKVLVLHTVLFFLMFTSPNDEYSKSISYINCMICFVVILCGVLLYAYREYMKQKGEQFYNLNNANNMNGDELLELLKLDREIHHEILLAISSEDKEVLEAEQERYKYIRRNHYAIWDNSNMYYFVEIRDTFKSRSDVVDYINRQKTTQNILIEMFDDVVEQQNFIRERFENFANEYLEPLLDKWS